ncbi:MAG: hypothetical protein JWN67_4182 [Actinomycetia bacterium]|nr:hypothetical protein [Actinomycetes bacterium]
MATHPFLSPEWIDEARRIHDEYRGKTAPVSAEVRVNLVVTDVPFGSGSLDAHVDTSSGELEIDTGHLDATDLTLTLDYQTARAILVEQNPQVAMSAFMGGRIKVQGDMTKLIVLQGQMGAADPVALEVAGRISDITSA